VIILAVRWYLRFGLSYRDLEELLAERGVEVDHVTLYRWVQRFTPLLAEAAKPRRHGVGARWFVDETYVKVAGRWRYVYRAVDQHGQVIDMLVSPRRDTAAARRFFARAQIHGAPDEVTTDQAHALALAVEAEFPDARHGTEQYANNRIESDHARLKARLRPMRVLKRTGKAPRRVLVDLAVDVRQQGVRTGHRSREGGRRRWVSRPVNAEIGRPCRSRYARAMNLSRLVVTIKDHPMATSSATAGGVGL